MRYRVVHAAFLDHAVADRPEQVAQEHLALLVVQYFLYLLLRQLAPPLCQRQRTICGPLAQFHQADAPPEDMREQFVTS